MKPLIYLAIWALSLAGAFAAYFEKSPAARLDIQFDGDLPGFYSILIWKGPDVPAMQLSGTLEKMENGLYREQNEGAAAPLTLQKEVENWRVGFQSAATLDKPPSAALVSGVYLHVSDETSAEHAQMRFEALDALLNSNYQAVRKSSDDSGANELQDLQRKWIRYRDDLAAAQPGQNGEGDLPVEQSPSYWDMKTGLTQDRIDFLKAWSGSLATPGITGTYRDFFGGEMTLRETNAGLEFTIDVVRGPTSHLGKIAGIAQLKGGQATYSDGETPPATLKWSFEAGGIGNLTEQNADQYHGARAYFGGEYFKVSSDVSETTD